MKKAVKFIFFFFLFLFFGIIIVLNGNLSIKEVVLINYDEEDNEVSLKVVFNNNSNINRYCNEKKVLVNDNSCNIDISFDSKEIVIENEYGFKKSILIENYFDIPLKFEVPDIIYLAETEEEKIETKIISYKTDNLIFNSNNEKIAIVSSTGVVKGIFPGITTIDVSYLNETKEVDIVVTSLILKGENFDFNKEYLKCNIYTKEEADLLDDILKSKINYAGYKTRAGVVAAARFLTLNFPYRINYFFENGRLSGNGYDIVDGEGRYYHEGLYLHESKYELINSSYAGPSIWGCPLTNYVSSDDYIPYEDYPNGLDCSGFVTWALLNGGFNVGDIGSGITNNYNLSDLGERINITSSLINSSKVKVGDLIGFDGHIGIIIGIDNSYYYIAESYDIYNGLVVNNYKKETLSNSWTYIMLMDSVYINDGNLTDMW